jgi:hypothetical protein
MIKFIFFIFFVASTFSALSQNIGIGTSTPAQKLEVKNPLRSTVKITSANFTDTTELLLSNRDNTNAGTDFSIKSIREEGLLFSSNSDFPSNVSANSLLIRPNGQIGIGIVPTAKLDINGNVKLQGLNIFEFGAGVAGKELNAGKIGYNAFGQNALTVVGAGTDVSNRRVYFFAEGGTSMNGPININGSLGINGNTGVAGQALVSNGAGTPSWQTLAGGGQNNVRFEATLYSETSIAALVYTSVLNTNTSAVAITSSGITINKTGLYHIEGYYQSATEFATAPDFFGHSFSIAFGTRSYVQDKGNPLERDPLETTTFTYRNLINFVQEVYIVAPTTINLLRIDNRPFSQAPIDYFHQGRVSGYLIAE